MSILIEDGKKYIENGGKLHSNTDVYKTIFRLAEFFGFDDSKTLYDFDYNWFEMKFSNNSGDTICLFITDSIIKSIYVYIDGIVHTGYKQYNLDLHNPVIDDFVMKAINKFNKENS